MSGNVLDRPARKQSLGPIFLIVTVLSVIIIAATINTELKIQNDIYGNVTDITYYRTLDGDNIKLKLQSPGIGISEISLSYNTLTPDQILFLSNLKVGKHILIERNLNSDVLYVGPLDDFQGIVTDIYYNSPKWGGNITVFAVPPGKMDWEYIRNNLQVFSYSYNRSYMNPEIKAYLKNLKVGDTIYIADNGNWRLRYIGSYSLDNWTWKYLYVGPPT